ncbi:MAG: hypothetical protein C5B55_11545 [Blastocatellia bacterium]|nr:MAG: hypothetical protein C5B55_11545 [Blastocatellia bacterium]
MKSNTRQIGPHDRIIIEIWQRLDSETVGASELDSIQQELKETFGETVSMGPASIARALADHGAKLRHAEVLKADIQWRSRRFSELFGPGELDFGSIENALESMRMLDELNTQFNSEGDETGVALLHELGLELKDVLLSVANSKLKLGKEQLVANEAVQWLTIWLQTPHLFEDWIQLRCSSAEFRQKFQGKSE